MTIRSDIYTVLAADATLLATLTGGVYQAAEISRQTTPAAFDANGEIEPCCLVNVENETAALPYPNGARSYLRVFFYERSGYTGIDTARERVFTLLNRQKIGSATFEIRWVDDIPDQQDEALDCSLAMSRYEIVRLR